MAETEPVANGLSGSGGGGGLGAGEEDDERLKQRPADIDADVREMERRKRVEAIMSSRMFREELERVLDQQLSEGGGAGPLLQRLRDMVGARHAGAFKGANCVQPINDIRGMEGAGYEKGEKILRCKLAALYRLLDLHGWTQGQAGATGGQVTARLNTAEEHFLTAPRGLLAHEVTASALVKLDMQGAVQDAGTTNLPPAAAGFALHALVHAARPDVRCVLHVRAPAVLAVSAARDGLLPLCAEAALLGELAYHRLPPGVLDNEERDKLVRALGPAAKVLVLVNGGALCCGDTLEEAFHQARCLAAACDVQLRCAALPLDKLALLDDDTRRQLYEASRRPPADGVKWRVGGEEFEALMRMLDNAGYRTGYIYRHPLVKGEVPKPKSDVEVPPAVSSLGYLLEEEELYRQGLWRKLDGRKAGDRTRWLASPNVYQKVELLETGTSDPRTVTKWVDAHNEEWVQDGSPAHSSTPVKIDAALQFVPKNTNPREFKQLQQQIKDNRRADKISAGPQSHILEGVTWDEAGKLQAEDAAATHAGDHVVLMGAASKGIIQRGYQHNASVYSAPYARNPFDGVSDRELEEYKRTVERKVRGDYDTDVSESDAAHLTSPDGQPSETEEESRDDHRILRIEMKQAPRPSQPEVVLSDDSTAELLAAERRAVSRELSREEHSKLPSLCPTCTLDPVFTTSARSRHRFSRSSHFNTVVKMFESPERTKRPSRRDLAYSDLKKECDNCSDKSSIGSAWSLDWDAGKKGYDWTQTRSLPRMKKTNLYRTTSHLGFLVAKDPEPKHFHLPRCKSCDAYNVSYSWEVEKSKSDLDDTLRPSSSIFDSDKEGDSEMSIVKVMETVVPIMEAPVAFPVMEATKLNFKDSCSEEFIDCQEFNDDGYLDTGGSFSNENLTVIEKLSPVTPMKQIDENTDLEVQESESKVEAYYKSGDIDEALDANSTEAECDSDSVKDVTEDNDCGDYMNFSDEFNDDSAYVSPVSSLVEKDIRNYTVPMAVYCDDYANFSVLNFKRSPSKTKCMVAHSNLEPIFEESKSSNSDDNNASSNNSSKEEKADKINVIEENSLKINTEAIIEVVNILDDIVLTIITSDCERTHDITSDEIQTVIECVNVGETPMNYVKNENNSNNSPDSKNIFTDESAVTIKENESLQAQNFIFKIPKNLESTKSSSVDSSVRLSFDSIDEFERFEAVTDIMSVLLERASFDNKASEKLKKENEEFVHLIQRKKSQALELEIPHISIEENDSSSGILDTSNEEKRDSSVENVNKHLEEEIVYKEKAETGWEIESLNLVFHCETRFSAYNESNADVDNTTTKEHHLSQVRSNDSTHGGNSNIICRVSVQEESEMIPNNTGKEPRSNLMENISDDSENSGNDDAESSGDEMDSLEAVEDFLAQNKRCEDLDSTYTVSSKGDTDHREDKNISFEETQTTAEDEDDGFEDSSELNYFIAEQENHNIKTHSINLASEIVDFILRVIIDTSTDEANDCSTVIDLNPMDVAFVETSYHESVTSSPIQDEVKFDYLDESPIKSVNEHDSPFMKNASVITMSHTEQKGGVKFWVSFDENLHHPFEVPNKCKRISNLDDKIPSFVFAEFTDDQKDFDNCDHARIRKSVLCRALGEDDYRESEVDSFETAVISESSGAFLSSRSQKDGELPPANCRKVYDTSRSRRGSSWPPFEDTLCYTILSKFRMSESFDRFDKFN